MACDGRAVAAQGGCDSHHTVRQGSSPWGTEGRAFGAVVSSAGDIWSRVQRSGRCSAEEHGAWCAADGKGRGAPARQRSSLRSAITSLRHWWRNGTVDGEPISGRASSLSARLPVTTLSVCQHGAGARRSSARTHGRRRSAGHARKRTVVELRGIAQETAAAGQAVRWHSQKALYADDRPRHRPRTAPCGGEGRFQPVPNRSGGQRKKMQLKTAQWPRGPLIPA